ncbi:MAG: NAD(P)H-dependent oxidoreductase [Spirochaetaceae bacterium]|nr:NAD(P)H-dependent oxidoreductase [Spirochaetaceae bacterium]
MKFLIISGNPKKDGLCHGAEEELIRGFAEGGADCEVLTLEKLDRCHVCGDGWGICREQHRCAFGNDGFSAAQEKVKAADAYCFITPVYWAEMAEALKNFFDRLRRCEASRQFGGGGDPSALAGKQVLLVASPGGSGNGLLSCLEQMDRFCRHTGAVIFDYIGINRWNNDYKKEALRAAARALAQGRKAGETL